MCCWEFKDVYLEDPPPKKKEEEENKNEYIMVSSEMETPKAPLQPQFIVTLSALTLRLKIEQLLYPVMTTFHYVQPGAAPEPAPQNGWDRLREAQDEARRNVQPAALHPAPAPASAPQNGWDRLGEAKNEARCNTPPTAFYSVPAAASAPVLVPFTYVAVPAPAPAPKIEMPYYYYYQPAYVPQPAMIAQPVYPVAHQMLYQPAPPAAPAKAEESIYTGDPKQEYWCRELDGSWSLRTATEITKECYPGFWQTSKSGYPVFYREKA